MAAAAMPPVGRRRTALRVILAGLQQARRRKASWRRPGADWGVRHDALVATLAGRLDSPFGRYWLSGFLADFGDGVRLAAFPLLAAQFTRSATAVAAVTAVQSLPGLVMGAGLGVLVDRSDRRRLMVIVDVARAAIIATLAVAILTHSAGLALIYLTAFITGVGAALRDTAAVRSEEHTSELQSRE